MPIIKKDEVMPERPVIIVIYGTPGTGKSSLACTSENPLLIDTDRGSDRACVRVDTLVASNWDDIYGELESFKGYNTIVVDTAKSVLDDFLADMVVKRNYKLKTNALKRFGEMADEFKDFVNKLRANKSDIVFVCHDKETAEGDIVKHSPDCTGQSKDLLVRIADQVGYLTIVNGKRKLVFDPTDTILGKNVGEIAPMDIPNKDSGKYQTCMADIISRVKQSINNKSEAQRLEQEKLNKAREQVMVAETVEDAEALIKVRDSLAKAHQTAFSNFMAEQLSQKGIVYDKSKKKFVKQ